MNRTMTPFAGQVFWDFRVHGNRTFFSPMSPSRASLIDRWVFFPFRETRGGSLSQKTFFPCVSHCWFCDGIRLVLLRWSSMRFIIECTFATVVRHPSRASNCSNAWSYLRTGSWSYNTWGQERIVRLEIFEK